MTSRDKILEAARKLFWEQGYEATGMAQILKEAGVSSGTLYYLFKSKEDLLLAVLENYKSMLRPAVIDPAFAASEDPLERIMAVLHGYRMLLTGTDFRSGCPIGSLSLEVGSRMPAARALIEENFQGWTSEVARCVQEIIPSHDGGEANGIARFVLVTMEGAVMLARSARDIGLYDDAVRQLRLHLERLRDSPSGRRRTRR